MFSPTTTYRTLLVAIALASALATGCQQSTTAATNSSSSEAADKPGKEVRLLNVSYDPTREFYQEFNESFAEYWKSRTGDIVSIEQSHGGSGKQALSVIAGLEADVVTLGVEPDIDAIVEQGGLIAPGWQKRLLYNSSPYTSTIVFLVRNGNPKGIKDWNDLVKEGVSIVTPNPKTSGGAKWNYLAAWGYILQQELGDFKKLNDPAAKAEVEAAQAKAQDFIKQLYSRVEVLDSGARASTNTFLQNGIGDVLLAWENEAFLALDEAKKNRTEAPELIVPSVSILAEPPVAVVDKNAEKHGTTEVAKAYLEHLYSPQGQQLAAKHFFRPALENAISAEQRKNFADVKLFTIRDAFGDWKSAIATHFSEGGVFDKIYQPGN
jgi:sulfate/thiosulfate transport system substrate-binding protein